MGYSQAGEHHVKQNEATRLNTGTLAMLLIVAVAVAAAAVSWWFHVRTTNRALALWGADRVQLIQLGSQVSLAQLGPDESAGVLLPDIDWQTIAWRDISHARGLIHLRQALVENRSFAWGKSDPVPRDDATIPWRYALRFGNGQSQMTVVLNETCDWMLIPADGRRLSTEPIASGLVTFFTEQFAGPTTDE